ncbi:MAG: hypothetical protein Q4E52_09680 [Fibrobacter sp.]|nr:hypothetical protein [Fibrobacter sp.]
MKKILFLIVLSAVCVFAGGKKFEHIRKCTKTDDRLICSQDGNNTEGFVYMFKDHKLYVHRSRFEGLFLGERSPSQFIVYKADSYDYHKNEDGGSECYFANVEDVEEFYCYQIETKHYFVDKYGFKRMEILKEKSFDYCDEKFNNLLP